VEVKGYNGTVTFDGQSIAIVRTGLGRVTVGKGQIRIPVSSVTAVQWKPAGPMVNGYIHFSMLGSSDRRSRGFGRQTADKGHDQNSVIFLRRQMPAFEELRAAVEAAIQRGSAQQPTASVPEQIGQLAALRDQGILTEDEFSAKKASLLAQI
jgi:Domain of unknown function (DUF4429)/Short C-terminal domain